MDAHAWTIILAAGDGTRLAGLTSMADGTVVPKQYCSFGAGRTLMSATFARARRLAPPERTLAIVAEGHRRWWEAEVAGLPADNVVVQPRNRGTAPGLLLPLLHVLARDSSAIAVVLPSDHHVAREGVLLEAIADATRLAGEQPSNVFLLGVTPDGPETEYGWIIPASRSPASRSCRIRAFLEKPGRAEAVAAMEEGGSWSSFILAGHAGAFVDLYSRCAPALLQGMLGAWRPDRPAAEPWEALRDLYDTMMPIDFSKDLLQRECARESLRLVPVAPCGWSDLGTPARLSEWLRARAMA